MYIIHIFSTAYYLSKACYQPPEQGPEEPGTQSVN